jgi:hypothetical protein
MVKRRGGIRGRVLDTRETKKQLVCSVQLRQYHLQHIHIYLLLTRGIITFISVFKCVRADSRLRLLLHAVVSKVEWRKRSLYHPPSSLGKNSNGVDKCPRTTYECGNHVHTCVYSYSAVDEIKQRNMVNSGVRGTKSRNLRSRCIGKLL